MVMIVEYEYIQYSHRMAQMIDFKFCIFYHTHTHTKKEKKHEKNTRSLPGNNSWVMGYQTWKGLLEIRYYGGL